MAELSEFPEVNFRTGWSSCTELQGKVSGSRQAGRTAGQVAEQMENKINGIFADIDPEKSPAPTP